MSLLRARGLVKRFGGVVAVAGVDLELAPGEILALIGPNGAGKSTLFAVLGGQLRPDAGRVSLDGQDVTGLKPRRLRRLGVARTFQVAEAWRSMTAAENVQTALAAARGDSLGLFALAARRRRDEALAVLERVGMAANADRPAADLAYGDVKRLELAVALAPEPRLLLMDEPTAGMGATERRGLMDLAARLAREDRIGVLFTEHSMDVVFAHAARVLVLAQGRILARGTPEAVAADPEVRAVYLGKAHVA